MSGLNTSKGYYLAPLLGIALATATQSASAVVIMAGDFNQNDCSGFFGQGFGSCQIWDDPNNGETTELSPVIIKFNASLGVSEINNSTYNHGPLFESIDGSEWDFTNLLFSNGSGHWEYTPDNVPGAGDTFNPLLHDPAIKYWAAKASNDFKLFWEVSDAAAQAGGACADSNNVFTIACLNEALVVTAGDWSTPLNNQDDPRALSHLTFYDSVPATNGGGGPPTQIPEPATLALLGTGLFGMGALGLRRRRR